MDVVLHLMFLVVGLVVLWKSAELLVCGAVGLAERLGISSLVIGLTVVAMGTSAPEVAASIAGVLSGSKGGEQSIRQLVIDRRITQGSRSLMGRQWNARIWTVLDTCRKQGRSAWEFLQNALSAYYFQSPTPSLLPQA